MGIKSRFSQTTISRQVQLLFILSLFPLCSILVLITKFQLDWIRSLALSEASNSFKTRLYHQIENIGEVEASYFESEFTNYEYFTKNLAITDELINGFSSSYKSKVFSTSSSYSESFLGGQASYSHGVYYSKTSPLSPAGQSLLKNESSLNFIYPALYTSYFSRYYQGYFTDEILNYYPSRKITPGYSPLPREWFYRGVENQGKVTITEPYQDTGQGTWVVSLSRAIMKNEEIFGVAACEVTLNSISEKLSKVKVLRKGFAVLVSASGILLSIPEIWKNYEKDFLRIFDSMVTGISLETWEDIRDRPDASWVSISIEENDDYSISKAELRLFKKNIIPKFQKNATHYLIIVVDEDDTNDVRDLIVKEFEKTYVVLFWVILAFGITILAGILMMGWYFGREITKYFSRADEIIGGLLRRGFFTQKNKLFDYVFPTKRLLVIENFKNAVLNKVMQVERKEILYEQRCWMITRPEDQIIYLEWNRCLYSRCRKKTRNIIWDEKVEKIMSKINRSS